MPYKIKKIGKNFRVTSPNHPKGFSKKPQSKAKALAQMRAIQANDGEGTTRKLKGFMR